jgi:hypothetical protein
MKLYLKDFLRLRWVLWFFTFASFYLVSSGAVPVTQELAASLDELRAMAQADILLFLWSAILMTWIFDLCFMAADIALYKLCGWVAGRLRP